MRIKIQIIAAIVLISFICFAQDLPKSENKAAVNPVKKTKVVKKVVKPAPAVVKEDTFDFDSRMNSAAEKVIPSVVSVYVLHGAESTGFSTETTPAFPYNAPAIRPSLATIGSGVILDKRGNIVTNYHVVRGAVSIKVKLFDQREYSCDLVGSDPATDIAVIRITLNVPPDIIPIHFADSAKLKVGSSAIAVGNSYNFQSSVTKGVISALGRNIGTATEPEEYIQTDTPLSPGNSGGALVDFRGMMIGMTTAIFTHSGGSALGFSIPSNTVKQVSDQILLKGAVIRGWSGLALQDLNPDVAQSLSLARGGGAVVADVGKGSPAESAGFASGDVLVSSNGKDLFGARDMQRRVADLRPGDNLKVSLIRLGKKMEIILYLGKYPESAYDAVQNTRSYGVYVSDIDEETALRYGITSGKGVVVVRLETGFGAESSGIEIGDCVIEVNGRATPNVEAFSRVMSDIGEQNEVTFAVKRHGIMRFIPVYRR